MNIYKYFGYNKRAVENAILSCSVFNFFSINMNLVKYFMKKMRILRWIFKVCLKFYYVTQELQSVFHFNPCSPNVTFMYPLKTFQGVQKCNIGRIRVNITFFVIYSTQCFRMRRSWFYF